MAGLISKVDAVEIPTRDLERARAFYVETLGLRPDENERYEFWVGDTCFEIWDPTQGGGTQGSGTEGGGTQGGGAFEPQRNGIALLRVDDVGAARTELEARGVEFVGETFDTGVCHMATFSDPDGNQLVLHRRYAPYTNGGKS